MAFEQAVVYKLRLLTNEGLFTSKVLFVNKGLFINTGLFIQKGLVVNRGVVHRKRKAVQSHLHIVFNLFWYGEGKARRQGGVRGGGAVRRSSNTQEPPPLPRLRPLPPSAPFALKAQLHKRFLPILNTHKTVRFLSS